LKPTRTKSPHGTYFVTFSTFQRTRLFVVENYVRLFLKTLYGYKRHGSFQLHAFVVMPEHVHLLLTPGLDLTLERAVQLIKGGYSHNFGSEFGAGRKSGREVLRIIAFAMPRTSRCIEPTLTTIRSSGG
jgi:REP element-mobilizing transposase RayT